MATRYRGARLAIAGALAFSVITGTAYFAGNTPTSASGTSEGSTTTTVEAPRGPIKTVRVKRSRGS